MRGSPAPSSSYSEPNENEAGYDLTNGGRREGPELTNESRSVSLVDLQDSSPSDGLDDPQWQRRTGLLPLSFQNPVYHMTTTSPRQPQQQTDATPSDGSVGSQGNCEDRSAVGTKPAFLTQMSVGVGGGERGERMSAMSSSSSGEEYSRRALSLTDTLSGSSAPPRQNSGPQRRIDQPPPPSSAPPGPPRGRTPPSMLSGGGSAYPPRPAPGKTTTYPPHHLQVTTRVGHVPVTMTTKPQPGLSQSSGSNSAPCPALANYSGVFVSSGSISLCIGPNRCLAA
ncbi:hypothetical protein XENOCAPTIV_022317 [Xenoophorus captivus]|uniref:Disabled homolog 2-interacting protein C-terminal domain-containing protein n=1 Tax=Xenoophorus captivus TaxID=1517983 RepID=A0ABV0R4D9_9TELE